MVYLEGWYSYSTFFAKYVFTFTFNFTRQHFVNALNKINLQKIEKYKKTNFVLSWVFYSNVYKL